MLFNENLGQNISYFDNFENYSNISFGIILKALSKNLRICFIKDSSNSYVSNLFENLSLMPFKNFLEINLQIYNIKEDGISKIILPNVEYQKCDKKKFEFEIKKFDLILIENSEENFTFFEKEDYKKYLENKNPYCDIVFITKFLENQKILSDSFNKNFQIIKKENKGLLMKKFKIILSNDNSKSFYFFGEILRKYIEKNKIFYFGFDKLDEIYSERKFFYALKKVNSNRAFYEDFDYVVSGKKRFFNKEFRKGYNEDDVFEIKQTIKLIETSVKNRGIIFADELLTNFKEKNVDEIVKNLFKKDFNLITCSNILPKDFDNYFSEIIKINELK